MPRELIRRLLERLESRQTQYLRVARDQEKGSETHTSFIARAAECQVVITDLELLLERLGPGPTMEQSHGKGNGVQGLPRTL